MGRSRTSTEERLGLVGLVRLGVGGEGGKGGEAGVRSRGAVSEEGVVRAEREREADGLGLKVTREEVEAEEEGGEERGKWDSERWEGD